jgi:acyl carrier protein
MENTPAWDSIRHLQLVMELEQVFGVNFSPTQIAEMTSLSSIVDVLAKLDPQ